MKPLLLGMCNPHSDDPDRDLDVIPHGATGWRIWKMIHDECGATMVEYMKAFNRKNLTRRPWNKLRAWEAAAASHYYIAKGMTVVILGDEVRRTLNLVRTNPIQKVLIEPQEIDGVTYCYVPHPSGRNHFYNDQWQKKRVAKFLAILFNEGMKRCQESERKSELQEKRSRRRSGQRLTATLPMERSSRRP